MKPIRSFVIAAAVVAIAGGIAHTADQTILGRVLTLRDRPEHPNQRHVVNRAREKSSPNTLVGNPTVAGASLSVFANGGTSSTQTFTLPAAGWSAAGATGFRYKDTSGVYGPVKRVVIKKAPNGAFVIRAVASGKNGPISVTPPNPGVDGCFALSIADGDTYHVLFAAGSNVKNKGANLFQAKRPPSEGLCPNGPSTTTSSTVVTTTTSTSTTSTTIYGSPSRAFLDAPSDLLD